MYCHDELFMGPLKGYFALYFPGRFATQEINTKITISWAHKQLATQGHILSSIYSGKNIWNTFIILCGHMLLL